MAIKSILLAGLTREILGGQDGSSHAFRLVADQNTVFASFCGFSHTIKAISTDVI